MAIRLLIAASSLLLSVGCCWVDPCCYPTACVAPLPCGPVLECPPMPVATTAPSCGVSYGYEAGPGCELPQPCACGNCNGSHHLRKRVQRQARRNRLHRLNPLPSGDYSMRETYKADYYSHGGRRHQHGAGCTDDCVGDLPGLPGDEFMYEDSMPFEHYVEQDGIIHEVEVFEGEIIDEHSFSEPPPTGQPPRPGMPRPDNRQPNKTPQRLDTGSLPRLDGIEQMSTRRHSTWQSTSQYDSGQYHSGPILLP